MTQIVSARLVKARFCPRITQMISAPLLKTPFTRSLAAGCCVGRLKQFCGGLVGLSFCSALSVKGQAMSEPLPKIQKVEKEHQNGSSADLNNSSGPLLRVKKLSCNAVMPSRASPLAAGYDLSSVAACVVPARGKAMVPIDLSIAIPEGTYARVGIHSFTFTCSHKVEGLKVVDLRMMVYATNQIEIDEDKV